MRRILQTLLFAALLCPASVPAGEQFARSLAGQFSITSEQGWPGRRYVEGGVVFAEEFDTNGSGKIDLWRFYRRGILSSEEQDLNHDGRVDLVTTWSPRDPKVQRLTSVARDTRHRGYNDLEMEAESERRWRIREDRNGDGVADRVLLAEGPYQVFEDLALNLENHPNVIDKIPFEYWVEYEADDGFCGFVTDYRRYSKGAQTHYGEWDGRRLVWKRFDPNNPPPPPSEPPPSGTLRAAPLSPAPSEPGLITAPPPGAAVSPEYAGDTYVAPSAPAAPAAPDAATGYYYDSTLVDTGPAPALSDRTRYEGLPPGDSAARSLPARMRPPGVGVRR